MSSELACTYAALILQDEGMEINAENMTKLVKAAGVSVEPFWAGLFEKALVGTDVSALITNIGSGMGSGGAAAAPAAGGEAAAEEKVEEKEESEAESSDDDMGFGLFD